MKAIARAGVGVDNIDTEAATRQGIVVMNTPGGNTISTAEQTFALMWRLSRNMPRPTRAWSKSRWDRKKYMGTQLAGKTLGIIGLGRIGQAVATRPRPWKCGSWATIRSSRRPGPRNWASRCCRLGPRNAAAVDYLTVHTPLTDETRNLIGAKEIQMLQKGVRLINCARGGIYNEAALVEGLKSGQLGGVALDVYATEPCTDSPLFGMPNVLCTPHLGASTEEAQANVAVEAAELLIDFFTTGAIKQAVNMSPLDPKTLEGLRGYLERGLPAGPVPGPDRPLPAGLLPAALQGRGGQEGHPAALAAFAAGLLEHAMERR